MEISIEKLINMIVKEVIAQLKSQNVSVKNDLNKTSIKQVNENFRNKSEQIDMSKYKTPVLTENHIHKLHELTGEIIIPVGTIITPKARILLKQKNINVIMN